MAHRKRYSVATTVPGAVDPYERALLSRRSASASSILLTRSSNLTREA